METKAKKTTGCSGQVMTEYAMMLGIFLGVVLGMLVLLAVFTEYGWRIVSWSTVDL